MESNVDDGIWEIDLLNDNTADDSEFSYTSYSEMSNKTFVKNEAETDLFIFNIAYTDSNAETIQPETCIVSQNIFIDWTFLLLKKTPHFY